MLKLLPTPKLKKWVFNNEWSSFFLEKGSWDEEEGGAKIFLKKIKTKKKRRLTEQSEALEKRRSTFQRSQAAHIEKEQQVFLFLRIAFFLWLRISNNVE